MTANQINNDWKKKKVSESKREITHVAIVQPNHPFYEWKLRRRQWKTTTHSHTQTWQRYISYRKERLQMKTLLSCVQNCNFLLLQFHWIYIFFFFFDSFYFVVQTNRHESWQLTQNVINEKNTQNNNKSIRARAKLHWTSFCYCCCCGPFRFSFNFFAFFCSFFMDGACTKICFSNNQYQSFFIVK